jgi:hypothetical protein
VDLLKALSLSVQMRGFKPESDVMILRMVFGEGKLEPMLILYSLCSDAGLVIKGEDLKEFNLPPEGRKAKFLEYLKEYITKVEKLQELQKCIPVRAVRLERLCSVIPETPRLDRLLRYGASRERNIDRTLNQLERVQRIRLGQPLPPKI